MFSSINQQSAWIFIFSGITEEIQFGSTNRAERVFREPSVSAFQMEPMVATGKHTCRLIAVDLVETHGAFGGQGKVFPGDTGKFLELGGGKALVGDGLSP